MLDGQAENSDDGGALLTRRFFTDRLPHHSAHGFALQCGSYLPRFRLCTASFGVIPGRASEQYAQTGMRSVASARILELPDASSCSRERRLVREQFASLVDLIELPNEGGSTFRTLGTVSGDVAGGRHLRLYMIIIVAWKR